MTEETSLIKEDFYENEAILTIVQILLVVIIIILVTKLFKHIWKTSKNAQIMRNYNKISNADEQTSSTCETTI